jgi:hypothetical protein
MNRQQKQSCKVQDKWDKIKSKRHSCPNCRSMNIHLNRSLYRRYHRYWIECFDCHWCAERANTIRGALNKWNKQ